MSDRSGPPTAGAKGSLERLRVLRSFLQRRLGPVVGLTLLLAGMLRYQSYENHPVLGRWSYSYAALLGVLCALWLAALLLAYRNRRGSWTSADRRKLALAAIDAGLVAWGAAVLLSSVADPESSARLLYLTLFGSITPAAAFLEWIAMLLFATALGLAISQAVRGRWVNVALAVGSIAATLLIGEGLARFTAFVFATTQNAPTVTNRIWTMLHVQLNSMGFRDVERSVAQTTGRRILLVGDSYAFGWGIEDTERRFGERIGQSLSTARGEPWTVINASRPGSNTLEHIESLRSLLDFRPDLVLLMHVYNDIEYLEGRPPPSSLLNSRPSSILGRLSPVPLLFRNSFLFQELYIRVKALRGRRDPARAVYAHDAVVRAHLGDLRRFVEIADSAGSRAHIMPFDIAVRADPDIARAHDRFVVQARDAGLPVWPIADAFTDKAYDDLIVDQFDHHPNELANALAAEAVLGRLLEVVTSAW